MLTSFSDEEYASIERQPSVYKPFHTFALPSEKHYQQQYADLYFLRLTLLKPVVEKIAAEAWDGFLVGNEEAKKVERVLDVRQGELCWVTGTVYMDMPLKPNILEDISKDVSASTRAMRETFRKIFAKLAHSTGYPPLHHDKNTSRKQARTSQ